MTDYRATLNLPKTAFPMKAELAAREPQRVSWWKERRTYERRLEHNAGAGAWILHDGPPYANGELHMGHFLNMVLKDMFVKIALLDGKYAKFVPGWDMHGLPIEYETLKHLGITDFHTIDPLELRAACKERALYWLDRQREHRVRMGNFGLWEHPYRTIDPSFEATIVDALADLAERQQIYKGLRSTLWCVHDETALAEAEIEYEQRISPAIYVRFTANDAQREAILSSFVAQDNTGPVSFLIWTTTPWTLPANVAIALRADAAYGLYRVDGELLIVAEALAERALGERYAQAQLLATVHGAALDELERAPSVHGSRLRDRDRRIRRSRNRNRRGTHRARTRCRRLRNRHEVRTADSQSGRRRRTLHRRGRVRTPACRFSRPTRASSRTCARAGRCGASRRSNTRIRTAGGVGIP